MANKIILKKTSTASKVPLSTDLEVGEIAVNLADQKLYSKDASGTVIVVGQGVGGSGTVTSVGITPSTGVTVSGSPVTTSGNITVGLSTKLTAIENLSGAGFITQNGSGAIAGRTIQAGTGISVAHGNGSSQDPVITNTGVTSVNGVTGAVTATNLLDAIKTVDGAGSGLDADTLDGNSSAYFQQALVSGTNIKTVNSTSLLGSGNLAVGTVTSVGATVPTGLTVSGSPITSSGTLAITYTAGYAIPTTAKQTEWDTAYSVRQQWNGGSTNLVASTGRTSLGGTTVGQNFFTLTNPSAVTFPRMNADNTVSSLSASDFRTAIGAGTGSGTVTSVTGGTYLTGGTITTSGTLAVDATSANTASKVVARDASGNFSAGTITASLSGNASTASDSSLLNGISSINLYNNMGQVHSTRTAFDATTPSYGFGYRFVQGNTNGPSTGGSQYYSWYIGLGSDYPATGSGSYGAMFAVDRNSTTPYLSVRYNEANSFSTWRKIASGFADTAGGVSAGVVTGKMIYNSFTATASQTTFTTTNTYTSGKIQVFANGVMMVNGSDVTVTSGTSVVFASGLASGTRVDLVYPI
jgi:hypothetical protein